MGRASTVGSVTEKFQRIIENEATHRIGLYGRIINFLEDILEDAECEEVYVDIVSVNEDYIVVKGMNCSYPVEESIEIFQDKYDIYAEPGNASTPPASLYREVVSTYRNTLHYDMKQFAARSMSTGIEYYLGILFNGRAFIIEGEEDRVIMPGIRTQCFSAHTHPSNLPLPSRRDIHTIVDLFINRGIGHVIETASTGLTIYRIRPIDIDDLDKLKTIETIRDPVRALKELSSVKSLVIEYI